MIDYDEIAEYCDLSSDQIDFICEKLGIQTTQDFCNLYEGYWTEEELIAKKEEFHEEHGLGSYRPIHRKERYLTIPSTQDSGYFYWFDAAESINGPTPDSLEGNCDTTGITSSESSLSELLANAKLSHDCRQRLLENELDPSIAVSYDIDFASNKLIFSSASGEIVQEYFFVLIGSYLPSKQLWMFGWLNPSLSELGKGISRKQQALADSTGLGLYRADKPIEIDSDTVNSLVSLAVQAFDADGSYMTSDTEPCHCFALIRSSRVKED